MVNQWFSIKNGDLPIKNDDLPIKNCDLPIKNGDLPIKNDDLPIKHGDLPIKNADLPIKNGDLPIKNGDLPIKTGDFPLNMVIYPLKLVILEHIISKQHFSEIFRCLVGALWMGWNPAVARMFGTQASGRWIFRVFTKKHVFFSWEYRCSWGYLNQIIMAYPLVN